ncbi:EpsG family protein, partial [Lactobacillus helveticus]
AKAGSIRVTFFIIEFLIVTPIYIVLYLNRKNGSMAIGITLFLFLFYNFSLSGMRQSIAMSLFLLATYFLLNGS